MAKVEGTHIDSSMHDVVCIKDCDAAHHIYTLLSQQNHCGCYGLESC